MILELGPSFFDRPRVIRYRQNLQPKIVTILRLPTLMNGRLPRERRPKLDWLTHLTDAPFANILFLAGLGFLAVGVFGKIVGKIEPDKIGRIASAIVGIALLLVGFYLHSQGDRGRTGGTTPSQAASGSGSTEKKAPIHDVKLPYGPDTCKEGFVWREAAGQDHVCVLPETRTATAQQNREGAAHRSPNGGLYGPDTCLTDYVWRDAFPGDRVCVTPAARQQAANDNAEAPARRASL